MRKLFYFPLESYQERYTCQLSAAKTGWLESRWNEIGLDYIRIDGKSLNKEINVGSVLDATGRGYWACSQIMSFLAMIDMGEIDSDDCLYFDDFWHPGISALPYAFHLHNIHPKMFAMLHAQSVDPHDFTYAMIDWIRPFEKAIAKILDGIFVTSTCLRDWCITAGLGNQDTVFLTGLPYNSEEVKSRFPSTIPKRKKQIVFSSRWDREKCPVFFLHVVDEVLEDDPSIMFVICTSAKKLKSNDERLLQLLYQYLGKYPKNLYLREGLTKTEYYETLLESRIQFNCANQDFVSWTLLEATTCGCIPVYPDYLSFPETLQYQWKYLYEKENVVSATRAIFNNIYVKDDCHWVYQRFDKSWERMLNIMRSEKYESLY